MRSLLGRSSNGSSVKYNAYNAEFLSLSEIGFEKNINFGARVIYPNSDAPTFTSKGCQFISESYGASIPALNAGTVILASKSSLLGNFVVIDHGLGLRVWYCGLSDIDLKENDIVTKGQSVGKTDRDALSGNEGFWIYVTFKNDILDPNAIIK